MNSPKILFLLICLNIVLFAQGRIIVPELPEPIPSNQVYLKSVDARIDLRKGAGNVTLEQIFFNPSRSRLEGQYLFPIPNRAQIHNFHLYINGQKTKGEILDSKEASRIYEDIVRSMRDPALLEYSGQGLFKARIFPIEPKKDRKIELSYAQVVEFDDGTYRFTLPIKQSGQGSIERFHMVIDLEAEGELATIYSPSHEIDVNRERDNKAQIRFEADHLEGDKDFILYYSLADKDINTTLLTFRPRTDRDGFFMLLTSPRYTVTEKRIISKDVIFVVDVSGSMAGEKIDQAKDALRYCVNSLGKEDRFEIIRFSSSIESFQNELKLAGDDERKNAFYFIDNLCASGGTNINDALKRAIQLKNEKDDRPTSIIFMTDGLPTEGETDVKRILQNIQNQDNQFVRIFGFGFGYDVNTFLLDKLSLEKHGSAQYVRPGENIEREVSTFFAKISNPVLTNPAIDFGDLAVYDIYPKELPDMFQGHRISVIGRYRRAQKGRMILSGRQEGQRRRFEYVISFNKRERENEFVSKLWANRKVMHLMNQIRFNREDAELVQSIKTLGEEYGIVTPYTSFLVREQEKEMALIIDEVASGHASAGLNRLEKASAARESKAEEDEENVGSAVYYQSITRKHRAPVGSTGKSAVMSSRVMKKVASSETETNMLLTIKRIDGKTFKLKNGFWVENGVEQDNQLDKTIVFLSEEYFELSRENVEIRKILVLGEQLMFDWNGITYKIIAR
jgi:Ca-activated chloride channel family protein